MRPMTITMALLAALGIFLLANVSISYAQDSVRVESYVESLPGFTGAHKYLPNYHPNWQKARDLGEARVTIKTFVDYLPGCTEAHGFLPDYHPSWQRPAKIEAIKTQTEAFTAQVGAAFVYVEPDLYINH